MIFNIEGRLIKTIEHNYSGEEIWNLRTNWGREVAAGMYIYIIETETEKIQDKLIILK